MKKLNSAYLRAVIALISGILLIEYKEDVVKVATKVVGILFFLSGIISIIIYYVNHKNDNHIEDEMGTPSKKNKIAGEALPFVGLGSCILGGILFFMTEGFISGVMIIFASMLILGAIGEFVSLIHGGVSIIKNFAYWILPCSLLLFGLMAILYPETIASMPFVFLGAAMIVYGVSEIINALKIRLVRKAIELALLSEQEVHSEGNNETEEAEIIEVTE